MNDKKSSVEVRDSLFQGVDKSSKGLPDLDVVESGARAAICDMYGGKEEASKKPEWLVCRELLDKVQAIELNKGPADREVAPENFRSRFEAVQKIFPGTEMANQSFEEAFSAEFFCGGSVAIITVKEAELLTEFFQENCLSAVDIDVDKPIGRPGALGGVFEAKIPGSDKVYAAKVFRSSNAEYFPVPLKEGLILKAVGELGVGPGFHGFFITEKGELVVLMDKLEAFSTDVEYFDEIDYFDDIGEDDLSHDGFEDWEEEESDVETSGIGRSFINEWSVESFEQQMAVLHKAGYTFEGDEGEILISADGSVHFVDFSSITRLNSDGKAIVKHTVTDDHDDIIEPAVYGLPTETSWYRDELSFLKRLARENSQDSVD